MSTVCAGIKLLFVLVLISLTLQNSYGKDFCIAKDGISDSVLQVALNYACGQGGANCSQIQPNQPCYLPNTVKDHASFAFNNYYQTKKSTGGTCDFNGAAVIVQTDPSHGACKFD